MVVVRRLGGGDGAVLELLARQSADFGRDSRAVSRAPLGPGATSAYLADPDVLHWVATDGDTVVGHLLCHVQRRRAGEPLRVVLQEIGVRVEERRRGVGQALVKTLQSWMQEHNITTVETLADDPVAELFYTACGFSRAPDQPVRMRCRL